MIDGEPLRFRGEVYHPYHFNCTACGNELTSTAREVRTRPGYTANDLNELYCLRLVSIEYLCLNIYSDLNDSINNQNYNKFTFNIIDATTKWAYPYVVRVVVQ